MDLIELYHERAAILQYEAKLPRALAEWEAYQELRRLYGRDAIPDEVKTIARKAAAEL